MVTAILAVTGCVHAEAESNDFPHSAIPIYVGKDSYIRNNSFNFEFFDIPTQSRLGRDQGNIAGFGIGVGGKAGSYVGWSAKLPAYTATKNATGLKRDTNIGNLNGTLKWSKLYTRLDGIFYGFGISGDIYLPTTRHREALVVAYSSPTMNFFEYSPFTTTLLPRLGFFAGHQFWSAKSELGYAYQYISKDSYAVRGKNRHNVTWQTAASWHAASFLNVNLEYNTLLLDGKNADPESVYRHAFVPSISGRVGPVAGNVFVSVPLDAPSRDISTLAFGLKAGFVF